MSKGVEQAPSKMLARPGNRIASPLRGGAENKQQDHVVDLLPFSDQQDRETPSAA